MDLCMCSGKCPISEYCLRYMGEANPYYQTYSALESVCIPNNYAEWIPYDETINHSFILNDFTLNEIKTN